MAAATLESLRLLREAHDRRKTLWRNMRMLQAGLRKLGFNIGHTQTPITPIQSNNSDALHMSAALYEKHGIWASAILYPAVPIGTSVLRVIPTANHTREDLTMFLDAIAQFRAGYAEDSRAEAKATSAS